MAHSSLLHKAGRRGWSGDTYLGPVVMLFPAERRNLSSEAAALARSGRENSPKMGWSEVAVAQVEE